MNFRDIHRDNYRKKSKVNLIYGKFKQIKSGDWEAICSYSPLEK